MSKYEGIVNILLKSKNGVNQIKPPAYEDMKLDYQEVNNLLKEKGSTLFITEDVSNYSSRSRLLVNGVVYFDLNDSKYPGKIIKYGAYKRNSLHLFTPEN